MTNTVECSINFIYAWFSEKKISTLFSVNKKNYNVRHFFKTFLSQ